VVAVCNWLNAPGWIAWGLPIVIIAGAVISWIVRLAKWAAGRSETTRTA